MLKMVLKTHLQFGVVKRLIQTFRVDSTGIRVEATKMLWADSLSTSYLIYRIPYVSIGLRIPKQEWRGKDTSLAHLKAVTQMNYDIAFGIQRVTRLSSEITQSPCRSSYTSEGSNNSRSLEDNGRSDEEDSEDGASSKEGGFETPQSYSEVVSSKESVQWKKEINEEMVSLEKNQMCSLVILQERKKASQSLWMFKVKEEQKNSERFSEKHVLGYVFTVGVTTVKWESRLQKNVTMSTIEAKNVIFEEDFWSIEPYKYAHQGCDNREVEALRRFNWPSR
ncbi:hypothetical protein Tco_1433955 [Tanacetum coccineum]